MFYQLNSTWLRMPQTQQWALATKDVDFPAKPHAEESKGRATWWSDMAVWFPDKGAGSWEFTGKVLQTSLRASCDLTGHEIKVPLANFVDFPNGS